jgi:hypothetical protein
VEECTPLTGGLRAVLPERLRRVAFAPLVGRGAHSFPFPLILSFLCPFPLN